MPAYSTRDSSNREGLFEVRITPTKSDEKGFYVPKGDYAISTYDDTNTAVLTSALDRSATEDSTARWLLTDEGKEKGIEPYTVKGRRWKHGFTYGRCVGCWMHDGLPITDGFVTFTVGPDAGTSKEDLEDE